MTPEEYRLIAFLLGETDQAPAPAAAHVPEHPRPRRRARIRLRRYAPAARVGRKAQAPCTACNTSA